ncbi:hypothetical protein N0V83_005406 [Neocucurbitaria cava]|uniref:Uncharacterized protein n=1 Tax=Neocucurbitaria cava TaxID=798079 RepID=A0A9W8Y7X2_9PLEO|nr:hypothetical protein N0V83_005406 [Neocucurbitaria cava]
MDCNYIDHLTMSISSENDLFWIEIKPNETNSEGAGISVTGPYTNSTEDQEILREKLQKRCEADPTAINAVNQLMDVGSDDDYLDQTDIRNAANILLFTILVTIEPNNKDITDHLKPGTASTVKHFYAVRMNGTCELSAEIDIRKLDWYTQLGSELFHIGDPEFMRSYRTQKEAIEHVEKYLGGKDFQANIVYDLQAAKGILIAAIAGVDFMLDRFVTVTKVSVELREDVYDIKGVE